MTNLARRFPSFAAAAVLLLLALAVYWPALTHDFVNCDDPIYVTENPRVQGGLSGANVIWAFTTTEAEFWHPLTWLSHLADCHFFGVRPWGHHLTNLMLHLANTLLVFLCMERLTGARGRGFVVAALVGLHPLHVESVAWVAERKDLLSGLFFLLALGAYTRWAKGTIQDTAGRDRDPAACATLRPFHPSGSYLLCLLFFALGLMSKPMVVTLPFVLLLLDYWPLQRLSPSPMRQQGSAIGRLLLEKVPLFALALVGSVAAWWIQQSRHNLGGLDEFPLSLRLSNALVAYARYLRRTLWPSDLAVFYPYPPGWPLHSVVAAAAVLAAVTLGALWLIRRRPYVAVGWFWFLGMLVPVIGLIQVGQHAMADRYTYLPLIGLFMLLVWGAAELLEGRRFQLAAQRLVTCAVLLACFATTQGQLRHWRNSQSLARHALRVTTNNYVAEMDLGAALQSEGRLDEAIRHYASALRIKPNHAPAHNNLALALAAQGHREQAVAHLQEALRIEPRYAVAHYLLGTLLDQQGLADEALARYQEALRLRPDFPEAANELGSLFAARNQWKEAAGCFARAVRLRPTYAEARNNLGSAHMSSGRLAEAVIEFERALRLKPDYADAHSNLGKALYYQGRAAEAAPHFAAALKANPTSVEALDLLARILATSPDPGARDGAEAIRLAERATELTGGSNALVLDSLAAAYAETGRFAEAVQTAERAAQQATAFGLADLAVQLAEHMKLYQSQRPLRE